MKKRILTGFVSLSFLACVTACSNTATGQTIMDSSSALDSMAVIETERAVSESSKDTTVPSLQDTKPFSRSQYAYVSATAIGVREYNSVDELYQDAALVITGKVIAQENYYHLDNIYHFAWVKVDSVRKGSIQAGDTILVSQRGGYATYREWTEGTHFEPKESDGTPTIDMDQIMAMGHNGYYPITLDDEVLLFLKETDNPYEKEKGEIYGPLSGYCGVFYRSGEEYVFPDAFHGGSLTDEEWMDHLKKHALLKCE